MESETATLGEIGYEAYRAKSGGKSLVSGQDIPAFADLKPEIKEAWEAAGDHICAACGRADAGPRRRASIEAAGPAK